MNVFGMVVGGLVVVGIFGFIGYKVYKAKRDEVDKLL